MEYFAISDLELRQFHMAGLVAGGGDSVAPVIDTIRARKISYPVVAKKPTDNSASKPCYFCEDLFKDFGLNFCKVCGRKLSK